MIAEVDYDKFPQTTRDFKLSCKFCGKPILQQNQGRGVKHLSKEYVNKTFCKCRINYPTAITFIN